MYRVRLCTLFFVTYVAVSIGFSNLPLMGEGRVSYTRDRLLELRLAVSQPPSRAVCDKIDEFVRPAPLPRYRGCRGGRHRRPAIVYTAVQAGQLPCIAGNRPTPRRRPLEGKNAGASAVNLVRPRIVRQAAPIVCGLKFGVMNVRSSNNNTDSILSMRRDNHLDILLLCETWHDPDSVFIRRLRADGMRVVERARPRINNDTRTNHGGVVIAAVNGVRLQAVNVGKPCTTFEFVCGRITSRDVSCVVLLVYRPGSAALCNTFFEELSRILDYVATLDVQIVVAGDFNIHLERPDEPHSRRFIDLLSTYGLQSRVSAPTHDHGGWLDVVATRVDLPFHRV